MDINNIPIKQDVNPVVDSRTQVSAEEFNALVDAVKAAKSAAAAEEVRHIVNGKEYKVLAPEGESDNMTIWAPKDDGGNSGYLLQSGGTGKAPTWADPIDFNVGKAERADMASKDGIGNVINTTYLTKKEFSEAGTNAQAALEIANQASRDVAAQKATIDSLEEQIANIGEVGAASAAKDVIFTTGASGLTQTNVQGALTELAGKVSSTVKDVSVRWNEFGEVVIDSEEEGGDINSVTIPQASQIADGMMSKGDKVKFDESVAMATPLTGNDGSCILEIERNNGTYIEFPFPKAGEDNDGMMSKEDKAKLDKLGKGPEYPLVSQTINGDSYNVVTDESRSLTIYAPTEPGSEGYILASTGSGAPNWIQPADIKAGSADNATNADRATTAYKDTMGRVICTTYLTKEEAGDINAYNEVRHLINGKEYKVATTDPSSNNVTIYAPTDDGGNAGYLLQSGGTGNAPTWADPADFTVGTATSANYATRDSLGNVIKDTYATKNDISGISSTAQQAKTLAEQANQNVALQQGAIDSLEEQLANIGETGVATSAEQVTFKVGTTGLTKVNVQGAMEELAGKLLTTIDPTKVYDTDKGVKVALKGTVSSPSVDVTTTLGAVDSNNSGLVSGASVKAYVDSLKTSIQDGGVVADQATNATKLDNIAASSYAKKTDTISATKSHNGVTVTLGGTLASPSLSVSVNGGTIADGSSSIVNANDVHDFVNSAISNQPAFTTQSKGLVPASGTNTAAFLKGDGTWGTPKDATVSQTVQNTANAEYPLLLGASGQTTTKTGGTYFDSQVTVNPNTNTITATTFKGTATKADVATKATQDGNGSVIATTYANKNVMATTSIAGLMSAADKTKLSGIKVMTGASVSVNGTQGLVPAPSVSNRSNFLRGDGTWATPTVTKSAINSALGYTPAREVPNTMVWGGILNTAAYATDYAVGTVLKVTTSESLSILKDGSLINSSLASGTNVIVSYESYMSGSSYNSGNVFVIF